MKPAIEWSAITEKCLDEAPEHWLVNEDLDLNEDEQVIELLQTGSVTTTIAGKRYVVELRISEAY